MSCFSGPLSLVLLLSLTGGSSIRVYSSIRIIKLLPALTGDRIIRIQKRQSECSSLSLIRNYVQDQANDKVVL
jgi:hypothetical protein